MRTSARRSLLILFAINVLNFYDRQALSALNEPVRKEFHLSDTQLGWLATAFTLLYALIGVPLGRLADRGSRKKLLAAGVGIWSALTGSTAAAASYGFLLFSRLGVAVGEAACAPVATSWLGDLFPAGKRSGALSLFMLGVPVGLSLSSFCSGPVAQAFGWRVAMALAAAPALLLIPALLAMEEPARGASDPAAKAAPASAWSLLRIPTLWWIVASGALLNFMMYSFSVFLASFLMRVHGLTLASAGISAGCVYGIGGVLGGLLGGWVGDRAAMRRQDGRMLAAALAALISAPFAYAAMLRPAGSAAAALALFTTAYGFFNMYYGLVYSSIHDIVRPAHRATAMAFYFMLMYLGGASFGSVITGSLSDRLAWRAAASAGSTVLTEAARAAGLQQAMLIIPALAIVLALVLYAGSRTIARDMARL